MEKEVLDPSPDEILDQQEIIVEKEWDRIEKLLAQKNKTAPNMAVIEADKLFREVLELISFGATVHEAIQNSAKLFSSLKNLLEVRKVYEDIVEVPGFFVNQETAKTVTAIYLRAILDLMAKDSQPKSGIHRLANEMAFFGESHPHLLRNLLAGLLIFLIGVWFLANTAMGKILTEWAVNFTNFVLTWIWQVIFAVAAILGIVLIGWLLLERRRR